MEGEVIDESNFVPSGNISIVSDFKGEFFNVHQNILLLKLTDKDISLRVKVLILILKRKSKII